MDVVVAVTVMAGGTVVTVAMTVYMLLSVLSKKIVWLVSCWVSED